MRSVMLAAAVLLASPAGASAAGTLSVSINGAGKVTGGGIDCLRAPGLVASGACEAEVASEATLTAEPAPGFSFQGWSGACAGAGAQCSLAVPGAVTATFRDVEPPVVTLQSPAAGPVSGIVPVSAVATDNGMVEKVELKVNNAKIVDAVPPYTAPFVSPLVPDGPVLVRATAFDRAGNSHAVTADVLVDNTPPSLTVSGPDRVPFAPGSTQTWAVAASDAGSGLQGTRCSVVPYGELPDLTPCSGAAEHSVSGLAEGRYTFTFKALDRAGNPSAETRHFRIETPGEAPLVELLADPAPAAAPPVALEELEPPQIRIALGFRYLSGRRATKLSRFIVRGVPAGATVTVRCPSGCARKVYAKTLKRRGRVSLKPLVRRPLKVHTTVSVTVSKPGAISAVKVLEIRARKAPLVTTLCQPPGASEPAAC